ncbi:hypothetical protein RGAI101_3917 [Roseobacter sp. GAI101]|nr:hypothetical protein RGAI101_3917 [Roseobacter sp. GAI101]
MACHFGKEIFTMIKSTMVANALRTAALWGAFIFGIGAASAQGMPA